MSASSTLTARTLLRRPGSTLLVGLLAAGLAAAGVVVPAVLEGLKTSVVADALSALGPTDRDVVGQSIGYPQLGPAPDGPDGKPQPTGLPPAVAALWGRFDAGLTAARAKADRPLRSVLGVPQYTVRTSTVTIDGGNGRDSVAMLMDPRFAERAVLTAGAWPRATPWHTDDQGLVIPPDHIEVALSTASAKTLGWKIGEQRTAAGVPGLSHSATPSSFSGNPLGSASGGLPLRLTGTFDAAPHSDDYWEHVPSVLTPNIQYHDLADYPIAAAVVSPEEITLFSMGSGGSTTAWYPLLVDRVDPARAPTLDAQLRSFTANGVPLGDATQAAGSVTSLRFQTSSMDALDAALATQSAMTAVFALTASGPVGAAIAVLAVACRVVTRSRRPALALLAARGASRGRLRALQAWHGVWFGAVPALLAGAVAALVLGAAGATVPAASLALALVVAALPVALLAGFPPPGPRLGDETRAEPSRLRRRLRVVVETAVVVLALLAAAALTAAALSGQRIGSSADIPPGAALAVLVPILAAGVGAVVALRLYPVPLHAMLRRERSRPGLTGFLGAARSLRERAAGVAPVLALLIGVSSAATSGVLLGSLQHEIDATARATVGADLQVGRVDVTEPMLAKLRALGGVRAVAPLLSLPNVALDAQSGHSSVTMLAGDPAAIARVQFPDEPLIPAGADLAASGSRTPVVVSQLARSEVDAGGDMRIEGNPARVVGVSPAGAPPGANDSWALVSSDRVKDFTDRTPDRRNVLIALRPGADATAVAASVRRIVGTTANVLSVAQIRDELTKRTGTAAIRWALIGSTVAAALCCALAVMLSLALGAAGRDRILGMLRALGARARTARGLAWWELWPPLTMALVVGLVVGMAVPAVLLQTVDFSAFIGNGLEYRLDPLLFAGSLAGFLVLTAVATAIALALSRRVRSAAVLRETQEG